MRSCKQPRLGTKDRVCSVWCVGLQQNRPPKPAVKEPAQPRSQNLSLLARAVLTKEEAIEICKGVVPAEPDSLRSQQQGKDQPPQPRGEVEYVFSYGGNMSADKAQWGDITVLARDPAFVVDPKLRLVFKHKGGFATLENMAEGTRTRFCPPRISDHQPRVHGVLYCVPKTHLRQFQNHDRGYVLSDIEVETYEGQRVKAKCFVSGPLHKLPEEVTPPEMYMRRLREGAAFNYLDPHYQAWLSSIETVPSAGLPAEYYNTPSRYISYSFLLISLAIVGGYVSQHL